MQLSRRRERRVGRTCHRAKRLGRRHRDEGGVALVAAVVVALIVVLLSTAAIEQSLNSLTQSAIANKQVNSTDAAEAGIQSEFKQITNQASVNAATPAGATFNCPPTAPNAQGSTTLPTPGAFGATYALSYAVQTGSTVGAYVSCATQQTVPLAGGTTYVIKALGNTASATTGSKVLVGTVFVPSGLLGTQSTSFPEAVFAGQDLTDTPSSFALNAAISGAPAETYSGYVGQCSNRTYGGDYSSLYDIVAPALPPFSATAFTGTCSLAGNLIQVNGNLLTPSAAGVTLTGGTGVTGSIYTNGPLSITAAQANVGGGIYASGAVNICPPSGSVTIAGGIVNGDATNGLSFCPSGTTTVNADINSAGPIDGGSPSVAGVLIDRGGFGTYANGIVNLTRSSISNSLYVNGPITLSQSVVGGLLIAGGAISLTGVTATGGVQGQGAVTLNGGTYSSVASEGLLTIEGGATVTGGIYSQGGINFVSGTVGTLEDEYGTVSCHSNKSSGPLLYYSATLSSCVAGANGPTAVTSFSAPFSHTSVPAGNPPDDYPTSSNGSMGIGGTALTANPLNDQLSTQNAIIAAVRLAANAINATSGVTSGVCSGASLPCVSFPSLNYDQNSWLANTSFCGAAVACTAATMNLETTTNCLSGSGSLNADVQALDTAPYLPTVIVTNCEFNTGPATGYPIYGNVAIFDSAGFNFPSYSRGWYSGDGNVHQLFLIVPSTPNLVYPTGFASCGLNGTVPGPDIVVNGALAPASNADGSSNIEDFLYTPGSVCETGSGKIYGKVYAGQDVDAAGIWNQTFFDISPTVVTAGTAALLGTPKIISVAHVSS